MGGCSSRVKKRQEWFEFHELTLGAHLPVSLIHQLRVFGKHGGIEKSSDSVCFFYAVSSVTHQVSSLKTFKNISNHSMNSSGYHFVPALYALAQEKTSGSSSLPTHNLSRHLIKSTAFVPLRQVSTRSPWKFPQGLLGISQILSLPASPRLQWRVSYILYHINI